jgi:hypothetical protein
MHPYHYYMAFWVLGKCNFEQNRITFGFWWVTV